MVKPKIKKLKRLGCPECMRCFSDTRDLNIHLKVKHNSRYFVKLASSYAYALRRLRK